MTTGQRLKRATPFVVALGIWFFPVPAGLTAPAWHLFAVFAAAIASVLIGAFPLLTASMLAVGAIVLTGTIKPEQAYSGFANSSVLLVVIAFIVAQAVVKSGLGRRISLFMVSRFGGSSLGLAYSIVLTDAAIAPAFPSNTARGGVLYPIVLSVAQGAGCEARGSREPAPGRLPHVLLDGGPRSLLRAVDDGHLRQPDRRADRPAGRARDRLREVAPRLRGAVARRDRAPAPDRREALPAARGQDTRGPRGGAQGAGRHGPDVARRVDHGRDLRADGRRLDLRQQAAAQHDQRRLHGLRRAAVPGRDHARRHHQAGRHAGDLPLARGAVRDERAAERARLHGLRRRAPRLGPGRPVLGDHVRDADRPLRPHPLHVREPDVAGAGLVRRLPRRRHRRAACRCR